MALADLLSTLERDAGAEVRAVRDAGVAAAAQIVEAATRVCAERRARARDEIDAVAHGAAERELAVAATRARSTVLAARAAMLDRARESVRARMPQALAKNAAMLGPRFLAAAVACAGDARGTLRCAPILEAAMRRAPATLSVVSDPAIATGIRVELEGGTTIEVTLDALLSRDWPRLATEVER